MAFGSKIDLAYDWVVQSKTTTTSNNAMTKADILALCKHLRIQVPSLDLLDDIGFVLGQGDVICRRSFRQSLASSLSNSQIVLYILKGRLHNLSSAEFFRDFRGAASGRVIFVDWKDKLENVFNPKKAEKVKNDLKVEADFTGYEIGEDVIYYTKYKVEDKEYKVQVKCMIKKINKCSITLAKYKCNMDFTDADTALKEQTYGNIIFEWTNELRDKDNVVVKDVKQLIRSDDILYQDKIKATYVRVDFGY